MDSFPLSGSADLAARINSYDWASTALGPIEGWPQNLRATLSIILGSRFPMQLLWGPEYIHFYNDAYIVIAGDKHPDALGRPGAAIWPEIWDGVLPALEGVRSTGEPSWAADQLLVLDRNGTLEEGYFTFSYSPVHGADKVDGVFVAVAETTRRVIGERRLRAIRDLGASLAGLLDEAEVLAAAETALARFPLDLPVALYYSFHEAEQSFRLAWSRGVERDHPGIRPHATADGPPWLAAAAQQRGQPVVVGATAAGLPELVAAPWGARIATFLALPIRAGGGPTMGLLVAGLSPRLRLDADYRDFLERVAAQIAAAVAGARAHALATHAVRIRDEFLSIAAHELKTPLTPVIGRLMLTRRRLARLGIEQQHLDDLERIAHEATRLADLIDVLLDVTQLRNGQLTIDRRATDLAVVVAAVVAEFQLTPGKHTFSLERPDEPALLQGDPVRLAQVARNLISNAAKYSPGGGRIQVEVARAEGAITLAVVDEGVGIDAELLPRIFERYYRVGSSTSADIGGLGIGLFVVHEIVRLHGGSIVVESTPGVGSRFTISLPVATAARSPSAKGQGGDMARAVSEGAGA